MTIKIEDRFVPISDRRLPSGTAKRLRPKAQGCFNPGKLTTQISTPTGLRLQIRGIERTCSVTAGTQPRCGWILSRSFPGLKQPWALGRNRFAVSEGNQRSDIGAINKTEIFSIRQSRQRNLKQQHLLDALVQRFDFAVFS